MSPFDTVNKFPNHLSPKVVSYWCPVRDIASYLSKVAIFHTHVYLAPFRVTELEFHRGQ